MYALQKIISMHNTWSNKFIGNIAFDLFSKLKIPDFSLMFCAKIFFEY